MKRLRQSGVALVTALLVVALASIAAAAMLSSADLAILRTATLQDTERAGWIADGIEAWVIRILYDDGQKNPVDSLDENWARKIDYLPVDIGAARGGVTDLQSCFNLNNLGVAGTPKYVQQFQRLLKVLSQKSSAPIPDLSPQIKDWIDPDSTVTPPSGAEDLDYLGLKPPHRAGNRALQGLTELRAIQGVTPEIYRALAPYVCAFPAPTASGTPVNINTASKEVLLSLSTQPDPSRLDVFLARREKQPADDVTAEKSSGTFGTGFDPTLASVNSNYFKLHCDVFVGSSRVSLYSSFYRPKQGPLVVLSHSVDDN